MSEAWVWGPRFIHVLSGVVWIGGASLWTMLIAPRILKNGPPPMRRPFLEAILAPLTRFMIIAGALTILSGFWVMGILVGFPNIIGVLQRGEYGVALGVGIVAALGAYLLGLFVIRPTGAQLLAELQKLPPNAPPSAEAQARLAALGKKVGMAGMANVLLGTIAIGAMVWAVNVVR